MHSEKNENGCVAHWVVLNMNMEFAKILKMEEAFNKLIDQLPKDNKGSYFRKGRKKIYMVHLMILEPNEYDPIEHKDKYMVCQCNENDDYSYQTLRELLFGLSYYGMLMSDFLEKRKK